jgi:hypothetical protein
MHRLNGDEFQAQILVTDVSKDSCIKSMANPSYTYVIVAKVGKGNGSHARVVSSTTGVRSYSIFELCGGHLRRLQRHRLRFCSSGRRHHLPASTMRSLVQIIQLSKIKSSPPPPHIQNIAHISINKVGFDSRCPIPHLFRSRICATLAAGLGPATSRASPSRHHSFACADVI